jgi:hypothetical protein
MTVRYPDLADYLAVAAAVTGLEIKVVSASTNLNLADSALHAPRAGFGDEDFYPDFREKAAVLGSTHQEPSLNRRQQARSVGHFSSLH